MADDPRLATAQPCSDRTAICGTERWLELHSQDEADSSKPADIQTVQTKDMLWKVEVRTTDQAAVHGASHRRITCVVVPRSGCVRLFDFLAAAHDIEISTDTDGCHATE